MFLEGGFGPGAGFLGALLIDLFRALSNVRQNDNFIGGDLQEPSGNR
jgi:hypothetical protein